MEYRDVNISLSLKRLNKMTRSHICLLIQEKRFGLKRAVLPPIWPNVFFLVFQTTAMANVP